MSGSLLNALQAIEVKRGPPIHSLVPTPRRRSDPELAKWNNEIENYMDDEYEGNLIEFLQLFALIEGIKYMCI